MLTKVAAIVAVAGASTAFGATIFSNSPAGDAFTNPGTTNAAAPVGLTNWVYNNVRNNGVIGIDGAFPRSGNGSVHFQGTQGPAGNSSKADIEYFHGGVNLTPMGTLGNVNALAYDWYRVNGGTAGAHLQPTLRMYVDADGNLGTTNDRGYLIYEYTYNTPGAAPTDQWVPTDVANFNGPGMSAVLWQVVFGAGTFDNVADMKPLSVWGSPGGYQPAGSPQNFNANSVIYGLSSGIGSGWGTIEAAVDNISIGFAGGSSYSFNFEVVPAPGAGALLAMGGLLVGRRRR